MAMSPPPRLTLSETNFLREFEEAERQAANNRGSSPVNNFTRRVRNSVAARRNRYPYVTMNRGNGQPINIGEAARLSSKNTRTGHYKNKATGTKIKTIPNYVPNNTNTKAIKEQKYRKAVPRLPVQYRGRMRLNANQMKTFTNIFTSSEDFGQMRMKIDSLNKAPSYKDGLRSYLMYIAQNTLPSSMEYQPPNVNYTEADPNFQEERLNAKP